MTRTAVGLPSRAEILAKIDAFRDRLLWEEGCAPEQHIPEPQPSGPPETLFAPEAQPRAC